MIFESYPVASGWYARSKDHGYDDWETITTYAIGIQTYIPNIGTIGQETRTGTRTSNSDMPTSSIAPSAGYVIAGGGADVDFNGGGLLIWNNGPTQYGAWQASAKKHYFSDTGSIQVTSIGIKLL